MNEKMYSIFVIEDETTRLVFNEDNLATEFNKEETLELVGKLMEKSPTTTISITEVTD